ncbi:fimbrial biogenesis chaperone [Yersinia enterocolitica]
MTFAYSSFAGVGFSRNRMVYPQGNQSISLKVNNSGSSPYLIQAKVSADTEGIQPAPFMVTPPLFRLEGKGEGMMRIMMTNVSLPTDRESVFYFSGRAIPASEQQTVPDSAIGASVSLSTRSIMKVFYRPAGLKVTPEDAPNKMVFTWTVKGLLVNNPTPYYQSFAEILLDGKPHELNNQPSMVAPFGELLIPVPVRVQQVTWQVMNDYGGSTEPKTQNVTGSELTAGRIN